MRLTPCPSRLSVLIKRANSRPGETNALREIARAFRAKRLGKGKRSIKIESRSEVKITLEDGSVKVTDALALALDQIEPASRIDRIRECPICSQIFWAGRSDAEACPKDSATHRKREQRRRVKKAKEQRAKTRTRRKEKQTEELKLSITTATICDAIFARYQRTERILDYCYSHLRKGAYGVGSGIYRGATIHRGIKLLVEAGYLNPGEEQEETKNRHYAPTEKLKRIRREELRDEVRGGYYSFWRLVQRK